METKKKYFDKGLDQTIPCPNPRVATTAVPPSRVVLPRPICFHDCDKGGQGQSGGVHSDVGRACRVRIGSGGSSAGGAVLVGCYGSSGDALVVDSLLSATVRVGGVAAGVVDIWNMVVFFTFTFSA